MSIRAEGKYLLISLPLSFILPPLAAAGGVWFGNFHIFNDFIQLGITLALVFFGGFFLARWGPLPRSFLIRWLPLCLPLFCLLAGSIPFFRMAGLSSLLNVFLLAAVLLYVSHLAAFALGCRRRPSAGRRRGALYLGALLFCGMGAAGLNIWLIHRDTFFGRPSAEDIGHGVNVGDYMPLAPGNKLVLPAASTSLRLERNHPRLDGAIAALPLYGAAAQALYAGLDEKAIREVVSCHNTRNALIRLENGLADIFFGARPSPEQMDSLRWAGLTPELIPLALEAFVFFVHRDNPVTGLSLEQIRDIYSRRLTNWRELGGPDARILPFQRPEGSGSQSAMRTMVMRGRSLATPLHEEYHEGMGELIRAVAEYRNRDNALGYSFRWYATEQFPSLDIRFLAVDGVLPSLENIRNGSYPLTGELLAVTCRPASPETKTLLSWLRGPEGQDLVARVGYVPLEAD